MAGKKKRRPSPRSSRKQFEEVLRRSEEKFSKAFRSSPSPITLNSLREGRFVEVNPAFLALTGYTREEVIGRTPIELNLWVRDAARVEFVRAIEKLREVRDFEEDFRMKSGELRRVRLSAELIDLEAESHVLIVSEDVTEQRRAEDALRQSEARFRMLAEGAKDLVYRYRLSPPRGFEYVSPSATAITGYTPDEHYADPELGLKLIHPDDRPIFERWLESPSFERPLVLRWKRKDGTLLWTEQHNVPVYDEARNLVALEGIARDITDRVAAEQALADRGQQLAGMLAGLGDIAYQLAVGTDPMAGKVEFVSASVESLLGYKPDEFLRDPGLWLGILHPDDRSAVSEATGKMILEKIPRARQYRLRHKLTGAYRWMEDRAVPQLDLNGDVVGLVGTARDVTERKDHEERLRLLESVVVHSNDAVMITDTKIDSPGPVTIYVNDAFTRMTGYTPEEAIGRSPRFLQGPRTDRNALDRIRRALETGQPAWAELINYRKDGSEFWVDLAMVPVRDEAGRIVRWVSVQRDITERKQAEDLLSKSRERLRNLAARLEAAREEERTRLAREVHDEFGQSLTGLKMDVAWLLQKWPADEAAVRQRLGSMLGVLNSTIEEVRRIATHLRPPVLDDLGLAAAIEWQVQELVAKSDMEWSVDLPVGDLQVSSELATAVFRIFQEALTNVVRHSDARRVEVDLEADGGRLLLAVRDDGKGIADERLTDTQSLGLVGMRERAGAFGGRLEISRRVEGGTLVKLSLPLGQSEPAP